MGGSLRMREDGGGAIVRELYVLAIWVSDTSCLTVCICSWSMHSCSCHSLYVGLSWFIIACQTEEMAWYFLLCLQNLLSFLFIKLHFRSLDFRVVLYICQYNWCFFF